jgi:hypothetical protein
MRIFFLVGFCIARAAIVAAEPLPFPPGIPVTTATVSVSVSLDPAMQIFRYAYTVSNSAQSVGKISSFYIDIATSAGRAPLKADGLLNTATGYTAISSPGVISRVGDAIVPVGFASQPRGWDSGPSVDLTAGWFGPLLPGTPINPGKSLGGFVLTSHGFPGIRRFAVEPAYDPDDFIEKGIDDPDVSSADAQQIVDLDNAIQAAIQFRGYTIGPVQPPAAPGIVPLIDSLISLKHQSAELGWLGDAKFMLKLDERLDQAKAALALNKKKLARTRLSQFVHDLTEANQDGRDERRDRSKAEHRDENDKGDHHDRKFANDEAFQLLKINADFIIAKLPTEAKDKDEGEECRRAEGETDDNHGGKGTDD